MTSREFTPRLLELGARLDRHGLNNGLKKDETIFRFFLEQYNDQNKNNSSSFSHLNFNQDASKFTPFPVDDWAKAKKKFNSISSDYNAAFNSSTQSGFHGSFSGVAMVKTQPWLSRRGIQMIFALLSSVSSLRMSSLNPRRALHLVAAVETIVVGVEKSWQRWWEQ